MAKRDFYKLHVQKRIEANGSASVTSESTLGPLAPAHLMRAEDPLKNISGEIDLPWTRPLIKTKSKVKGKKQRDRQPVDRTAKVRKRLESKTKLNGQA